MGEVEMEVEVEVEGEVEVEREVERRGAPSRRTWRRIARF